jgi:hypothetical protein
LEVVAPWISGPSSSSGSSSSYLLLGDCSRDLAIKVNHGVISYSIKQANCHPIKGRRLSSIVHCRYLHCFDIMLLVIDFCSSVRFFL